MKRFVLAGAVVLGASLAVGCSSLRTRSTTIGTLSCSCSGTGCGCSHCRGEGGDCRCRATDAYGGRSNVGEPGD